MTLKFIQGNIKTDFLDVITDKIISLPKSEDIFLIVPNNIKFKTEITILKRLKEKLNQEDSDFFSLPNLKIYSFDRLVWYFLNDTQYFQLPQLTTSMKNMFLTLVLLEENANLLLYRNFASNVGFIQLLLEQIEILENSKIDPNDLFNIAKDSDNEKLKDLSLIYQVYETKISQPFRDTQSDFYQLNEYLKKSNLNNEHFIFFDYLNFNKIEFDLFNTLIREAKEVIFLQYFDQVYQNKSLIQNIKSNFEDIEFIKLPVKHESAVTSLFTDNKNNFKEQNISLFKMFNRYDEVKRIALEISHLIRNKNAHYNDFLIIGSQINSYETIFDEVFGVYNIPFFGEFTNSLSNSIVTFILKKLLYLVNNYQTADIFDLLKTGLFFDPNEINSTVIADSENIALELGISGWDLLSNSHIFDKINKSFIENKKSKIDNFKILQNYLINIFLPFLKKLKERNTTLYYVDQIYNFFQESNIFNNLENRRSEYLSNGDPLSADRITQEVNSFNDLLDEIITIFKDQELSISELSKVFLNGFKTKTYAMVPASIDQVQIADNNKVNLADYKYVWVVNVADGLYPYLISEEKFLLSNDELSLIAKLTDNNFILNYLTDHQNESNQMLDYLLLSLASQHLFISYSTNVGDNSLLPSYYFNTLKDQLGIMEDIYIDRPISNDFNSLLLLPDPSLTDLLSVMRDSIIYQDQLDKNWSTLFYWFNERSDKYNFQQILSALKINDLHKINKDIIEKIFQNQLLLSITKVETYFRNPYEFFIRYILKVQERKVAQIDSLVGGLVFHETLDLFFKYLKTKNSNIFEMSHHDILTIVNDLYEKVIIDQNLQFLKFEPIEKYSIGMLKDTIISTLRSISDQGIHSKNLFTELSFGHNNDLIKPAFSIDNDDLILTGKIDRVDIIQGQNTDYFNIFDYKSSARKFSFNNFVAGLDIQLITYLEILNDYYFKSDKQKLGGGFFYHIQDPIIEYKQNLADYQKDWLSKFAWQGIFLEDQNYLDIIKGDLDQKLIPLNSVLPFKDKKCSRSDYWFTNDQFNEIFKYNRKRFSKIAKNIFAGEFEQALLFNDFSEVNDYRFNPYQAILLFDPEISNNYQFVKNLDRSKLLEIIKDFINE